MLNVVSDITDVAMLKRVLFVGKKCMHKLVVASHLNNGRTFCLFDQVSGIT